MFGFAVTLSSLSACFVPVAHALVAPAAERPRLHSQFDGSPPSVGEATCRCCWRDCAYDSQDGAVEEQIQVSPTRDFNVEGADHVDAWLFMGNDLQQLERNMYTPLLESVRYGLRNATSNVRIINSASLESMLEGISAAAAEGKQPLVVAVAFWKSSLPNIEDKLRNARERGAYLVLYQSEPAFQTNKIEWMVNRASSIKAHEVWDYAMANIDQYPSNLQIPVRFIPPGYSPRLEVGVDLDSPMRDESTVGYMGMAGGDKQIYWKYQELFGKCFHSTNSIWSRDDLRRYLETYPIQLNMHKLQTCCPRDSSEKASMHMEAFRFAELLSNKACIISPPGSDKDNQKWAQSVHIVDFQNTHAAFETLKKDVRACQVQSFERFKAEFDAEKILVNSGFLHKWSPATRTKIL